MLLFVSDSCQSFAAAMKAMLQTSSLVGCLSDSRQLSQREITHQVSQGGSLRKVEKADDASRQIMSVCCAQTFLPLLNFVLTPLLTFFRHIPSRESNCSLLVSQRRGMWRIQIHDMPKGLSMTAFNRHSLPCRPCCRLSSKHYPS